MDSSSRQRQSKTAKSNEIAINPIQDSINNVDETKKYNGDFYKISLRVFYSYCVFMLLTSIVISIAVNDINPFSISLGIFSLIFGSPAKGRIVRIIYRAIII